MRGSGTHSDSVLATTDPLQGLSQRQFKPGILGCINEERGGGKPKKGGGGENVVMLNAARYLFAIAS